MSAQDAYVPINVAPSVIASLETCFIICSLKLAVQRPTADSTRRTAEPVRRALNCHYDFVHRKTTDVVPR